LSYIVLARKYRPATFDDFVGQEAIATTLKNAVEKGRVAHAYLFAGERGVGKTSMARVLAKALNCEKGPTGNPCNECDICRRISAGDDIDVIEIDGASHRTVEEISEVLRNVGYRPVRARFKIYIIDEVHMLSAHAFNALLKTLEEPPEHVKFIFATTEPNKVLPTVRSRCQRFDFRRISEEEIAARLAFICEQEGAEAEEGVLMLIARSARGGMRDAQSILDQLLSISPKKVTMSDARMLLGLPPEEKMHDLVEKIIARDAGTALETLHEMLSGGTDALDLVNLLTDYFRDLLMLRTARADSPLVREAGASDEKKRTQASKLKPETLLLLIQMLLDARQKIREGLDARILLEMAVVKMCSTEDLLPLREITEKLDNLLSGGLDAAPQRTPTGNVSEKANKTAPRPPAVRESTDVAPEKEEAPPLPDDANGKWSEVLRRVEKESPTLANFLRLGEAKFPQPDVVQVALNAGSGGYIERRRQVVERYMREVFGGKVRLQIVPVKKERKEQPARETTKAERAATKLAERDAVVSKVLEIFNGRILRVEDK